MSFSVPVLPLRLAALFMLLAGSASGQAPTVTRDILYTADITGSYNADLYQPSSAGLHPALVMIHGGSWRTGHKEELRKLGIDLASHGYVCFSIDYDTHPRSFPTSWQEARAALLFLRAHAAEYRIDRDRIAVLGTSAGGQLAALLAVAPEGPAATSLLASRPVAAAHASAARAALLTPQTLPVAAAVLFNGGYDAHPHAWVLRRYLGGSCEKIPAICTDASPDTHVQPGLPPIFVGHGTRDHLIPYSQATTFISLLQFAHDPVTPFSAQGAGHSYWRNRHWYGKNLAATEAFLSQSLAAQ